MLSVGFLVPYSWPIGSESSIGFRSGGAVQLDRAVSRQTNIDLNEMLFYGLDTMRRTSSGLLVGHN